ncbi:MAG TPA: universal stress protein, partial [Paucimonas sp.]|nr:universal stress protein [Paucimonas sp.]
MYKHILLPTDGSELSEKAIASGVLLAKNIGATVVGVYVV